MLELCSSRYLYIMSAPLVLVSASDIDACYSIIKGIVKDESSGLENHLTGLGDVPWTVDNKYYCADIRLRSVVDGQKDQNIDFSIVEAVIIYVCNFKGESLATADKRRECLAKSSCEVNILVCDKCDVSFPREQAMVWCLDNDYQLIELHDEPDPLDESCPIKDHYGVDRIIHTLHTHAWSNHEPKDESMMINNFQDSENDGDEEGQDDLEYMDEFCKLFAQMTSASQNASSMPSEGRKAYAEQVVKAFWKAIGGDESELDEASTS